MTDFTPHYLPALLAGDLAALRAGFAGAPQVDEPLFRPVHGAAAFEHFANERHAWLAAHAATLEPVRTTATAARTVVETLLRLQLPAGPTELPIAVVGVPAAGGKVSALRVYHSQWPLYGRHAVRPPLLARDESQHVTGIVAAYQAALAAGDLDAIMAAFEPDGYFREPAGGEWI